VGRPGDCSGGPRSCAAGFRIVPFLRYCEAVAGYCSLERLHGGTGIVLDDIAAGAYGLLVMWLVRMWW